ncbi:hypothetical protein BKA93DRAFT_116964 [Sparassis latifolia]
MAARLPFSEVDSISPPTQFPRPWPSHASRHSSIDPSCRASATTARLPVQSQYAPRFKFVAPPASASDHPSCIMIQVLLVSPNGAIYSVLARSAATSQPSVPPPPNFSGRAGLGDEATRAVRVVSSTSFQFCAAAELWRRRRLRPNALVSLRPTSARCVLSNLHTAPPTDIFPCRGTSAPHGFRDNRWTQKSPSQTRTASASPPGVLYPLL